MILLSLKPHFMGKAIVNWIKAPCQQFIEIYINRRSSSSGESWERRERRINSSKPFKLIKCLCVGPSRLRWINLHNLQHRKYFSERFRNKFLCGLQEPWLHPPTGLFLLTRPETHIIIWPFSIGITGWGAVTTPSGPRLPLLYYDCFPNER